MPILSIWVIKNQGMIVKISFMQLPDYLSFNEPLEGTTDILEYYRIEMGELDRILLISSLSSQMTLSTHDSGLCGNIYGYANCTEIAQNIRKPVFQCWHKHALSLYTSYLHKANETASGMVEECN